MKSDRFSHLWCAMLLSAGLHSSTALELSDVAGTWRIASFSTPSRLTLQTNQNGVVIGIPEASHFERSVGSIDIQSNGTFSGEVPDPISGTVGFGGQGELIVTPDGGEGQQALTFHINETADVMIACGSPDEGFNDLIIGVRAPSSLSTNDLAGFWNVCALKSPYQLDLELDSSNQVVNVKGLSAFESFGGTMTVGADGSLNGQIQNPFTGTVEGVSNGVVNVSIVTGEGTMSLSMFVNAAKDTLVLLDAGYDEDDNYQELMVFQKAPTNNVVAELAGHWRIAVFDVPQLVQITNAQGKLVALDGRDDFDAVRQKLVAGYDGFFTAQVDGIATGTLSPDSDGIVDVSIQSAEGSDALGFQLNASQTLLGSSRLIDEGHEFLLVTKSPAFPGSAQDFGLIMSFATNSLTLQWAAATNAGLEASADLATWQMITNTVGAHSFTVPSTNSGANLFRVARPAP